MEIITMILEHLDTFINVGLALFVLGVAQSAKISGRIPHNLIPIFAGVLGMFLGVAIFIASGGDGTIVDAFINGGISGFATVGVFEATRRGLSKDSVNYIEVEEDVNE